MKNKKFIFISLLILAIGFAAVSTTLYISGNLLFGTNKNDFEVYFSGAIIDDEDKSNEVILSDKKHIEYETKELKKLGDTSVLEFEVTNNSTQYDAKVSISCTLTDNTYVSYTTDKNEYNIPAQTRESGKVIVELIKASTSILNPTISCELVSRAQERNATAETVITDSSYEITGTLIDEEGNILANKNLVVYSETPHYVTTDDYGFFYVSGLEKGSHEIYYVNEENVEGKTKEEVKELSTSVARITTNSTSINFDNIKLNDFKIGIEKAEEINITLDADSGSIESNTFKINKYQKGSDLPTPTPKNSNYEFLGWYSGDKKITNNTIITSEMNLVAKWNYNCPYEAGQIWSYNYTGTSQTFTIPCDGTYKLEVWGAQGGGSICNGSSCASGGYGGYSSGSKSLFTSNSLYIVVGGAGCIPGYNSAGCAGYNGGGSGYGDHSDDESSGGGGGATHIATTNRGVLSNYNSYRSEVLIVAGGGGGASWYTNGNAGGTGGGASFGQGASGTHSGGGSNGTPGGGGGWIGGCAGNGNNSGGQACGGTSYVGGVLSGTTTAGSRAGNGYARITLVSLD